MNRKLLFIPLVLFLALAAALFWQLMRNADGDDPTTLESALIGKPLPEFRLEALNTPGQTLDRRTPLVATGFLVGKKIGMHPIDVAIVSCCQSGQGGTGDVAILTAGNRMSLMPFAQIATRIGGAINVSLGLLFLSHYLA